MSWISKITNYNELPKNGSWVAIVNNKAYDYDKVSAFVEKNRVLVFTSREIADYFINHWDGSKMNDYRKAVNQSFNQKFWVIYPTPKGYYADEINYFSSNN